MQLFDLWQKASIKINLYQGASMQNFKKILHPTWRLAAGGWRLAAGGWRLAAGGLAFALLNACGGGGGAAPEQSVPIAVNTSVGSSVISNSGGIVSINGNSVVELSAGATTSPSTVTVMLRPSTTGGLTDEVVVDLSEAVPTASAVSEVSVYIYPISVKKVAVSTSQKANLAAGNNATVVGLTTTVDTFIFAGSTVPYTLDQLDVVGTTGSIKLLASQLIYEPAKARIKATFAAGVAAVTTVKALGGAAKEFAVNVYVGSNQDNATGLYHFPGPASVGTEVKTSAPTSTKIPLILVHGIQVIGGACGGNSAYKGTWDKFREHFFGDFEMSSQYELYSFGYPTNIDFKTNGKAFSEKLAAVFGNKPVVVVAHSMGGLVTRAADLYYSSKLQSGNATDINIARAITLNTPHHGTPYIFRAAAWREMACRSSAQSTGGPSLDWDDLENNGSCTNSNNPVLCEMNSLQNVQHLKKYVPYSAYSDIGTTLSVLSSTADALVSAPIFLLRDLANPKLLLSRFTQPQIDKYFLSPIAKQSDIAVLIPSQRLMTVSNNQWVDRPNLFAELPDAYPATLHVDAPFFKAIFPGITSSTKVWHQKADGTPGGIRGHLSSFALQLAGKPDLIPSAVTVTPASVQPGGVVTVAWQIANSGNANAAASTTGLRLVSAASSGSGAAADSLHNVSTGALAAGGVANQSQAITIPAGTAPGSYVVVVVADNVATSTLGQSNVANDYARSNLITVNSGVTADPLSEGVCTALLNEIANRTPNVPHVYLTVGLNSECKSSACVDAEISRLRAFGLNAQVNTYSLNVGGYSPTPSNQSDPVGWNVPGCVGIRDDIANDYGFTTDVDRKKISDSARCIAAKLGAPYFGPTNLLRQQTHSNGVAVMHASCTADGSLFPIVAR